ncbi:hypothetical protein ND748_03220 [Frankia sp. AiPs1]|uniref:hypothetical protein n=1 Tax=Frankia sp. AiPs1 TaxID=573493 RepID=UPI002042DC0D|nr:hypothetical protein [Frankia sp. AiPs1]MCM3920688.1 hypothetical protein [Frankia sp. AiPs1]
MTFFDGASSAVPPRPVGLWLTPPDHQLAGVVPLALTIGHSADTAVSVACLAAYPAGVEITLEIRLRPGTGPDVDPRLAVDWRRDATRMVRFGVALPDGSRAVAAAAGEPLTTRLGEPGGPLLTVLPAQTAADEPRSQYEPFPFVRPDVRRRGVTYGSAGVVSSRAAQAHRLRYWLWPLPPEGPLTFVAEFLARGLPESRVSVDGAAIRAAADRAVDLWPAAGLPEPGAPPAEVAAAAAEVKAAFTTAFTGGQDVETVLAAVDDGAALRSTLATVRELHPRPTASARVLVGEPVFSDPTHASLPFEVVLSSAPSYGTQLGEAVLVDGRWKVARSSYCAVMSWAGVFCPDRVAEPRRSSPAPLGFGEVDPAAGA